MDFSSHPHNGQPMTYHDTVLDLSSDPREQQSPAKANLSLTVLWWWHLTSQDMAVSDAIARACNGERKCWTNATKCNESVVAVLSVFFEDFIVLSHAVPQLLVLTVCNSAQVPP